MSDIDKRTISSSDDFLAFIKDPAMNNGNLSIRGVARCCDVADTSIVRGAAFATAKLAKTMSGQGFEAAALICEGFPPQAVWLTIEYFAYESKAKAPMAKQLARTFGSIGIMTTLEQLREKPEPAPQPTRQLPPIRDAIEYLNAIKQLPDVLDPILNAALRQRFAEELGATNALPGKDKKDDLVLAAVVARDLGYELPPGKDSQLGKFVKKYHTPVGRTQHGRYQVYVYRRAEIEKTVRAFFGE